MNSKIKIIVADDHEVYRDGLKALLQKNKNFDVIGQAANGDDLIRLAKSLKPDIIITDIVMPGTGGLHATREIKECCPFINIIALSMCNERYTVTDMLEAGASGFLTKNAHSSEILEAVKQVNQNHKYFCSLTRTKLANAFTRKDTDPNDKSAITAKFNSNEKAILKLMCREKTNKEIAHELNLSVRTVESYKDSMFKKTNSRNAAGLIMFSVRNHLD